MQPVAIGVGCLSLTTPHTLHVCASCMGVSCITMSIFHLPLCYTTLWSNPTTKTPVACQTLALEQTTTTCTATHIHQSTSSRPLHTTRTHSHTTQPTTFLLLAHAWLFGWHTWRLQPPNNQSASRPWRQRQHPAPLLNTHTQTHMHAHTNTHQDPPRQPHHTIICQPASNKNRELLQY